MSEFNLLDENWIKIQSESGNREVGLLEFFENAHTYKSLDGELPTQNFAVLRLLLAIMYAALYKNIESYDDAVELWLNIYKRGKFDYPVIRDYLENYRDRFYLFDEKFPFYQVNGIKGTDGFTRKLNGEINESGTNKEPQKSRIFSMFAGKGKDELSYSEAARWIIHMIGYDDTAIKPYPKKSGVGWLGKLGGLYIERKNLFETLLYNFVVSNQHEPWEMDEKKVPWEYIISKDTAKYIITPNNPLEMLTVISRKIVLKKENGKVVGYTIAGGDSFSRKENAFAETMTLWRNENERKKNALNEYVPKTHYYEKLLWTSLDNFLVNEELYKKPGVLEQISNFEEEKTIQSEPLEIKTVGMIYVDKKSSVVDVYSDQLSFNGELLTTLGTMWCKRISNELKMTDDLCKSFANLAGNLYLCNGGYKGKDAVAVKKIKSNAKSEAYILLDVSFRKWISRINVNDDIEEKSNQWWSEASAIIKEAGNILLKKYSLMICKERGGLSIPVAEHNFKIELRKLEVQRKGG
jgi:CRISPR system Cascade subunit CasA